MNAWGKEDQLPTWFVNTSWQANRGSTSFHQVEGGRLPVCLFQLTPLAGGGGGGGVRVLPSVLIEKGWDGRSAPSSASLKPYRRGVVLVFGCNRVSISKIVFLFC